MGAYALNPRRQHHPRWHGAAVLLCLLALLLTNPARVLAQTDTQTGAQEEVSSTVMNEVVRRPAWGLYQGYAQGSLCVPGSYVRRTESRECKAAWPRRRMLCRHSKKAR